MIRLGIIGAENSHSFCVANICNNEEAVPMRVVAIWGETEEFAQAAAKKGSIPKIVSDWRDMAGEVDVVMIDHRHAKYHYEPAEFYLKQGIPVFADKPMTFTTDEGRKLLDLSESTGVPVLTFSSIPRDQVFQDFKKKVDEAGTLLAVNSSGPSDIESPHGGVFFYGIHQVDAMVELMGVEAESVTAERVGDNAHVTVRYSSGRWGTINLIVGSGGFNWMVSTDKAVLLRPDERDPNPFLVSAQLIHDFAQEKKSPFSRERMFAPIAILEAIAESLASGKTVQVQR